MTRSHSRHGWTLLETLIALGLLVLLAALVMPAALESLDDRAFDSSADVVASQILMARSHAQATGAAMEVVYESDPPRVSVRAFEPGAEAATSIEASSGESSSAQRPRSNGGARPSNEPGSGPRGSSGGELDADPAKVPESWASRALADGLTMQDRLPTTGQTDDAAFETSLPTDTIDDMGFESFGQALRLAVMLPDGTSMMSRPAWLTDGEGRVAELSVNAWTGEPLVQRVEPAAGDSAVSGTLEGDRSSRPTRTFTPDDEDFNAAEE